jgi:hypothetical protein
MQTPPIFDLCNADATVLGLLKSLGGQLRVYPFGFADQKGYDLTKPYLVWQTIGGAPDNKLEGGAACSDLVVTQLDVYSDDVDTNRAVVNAVENAINNDCHITGYVNEELEQDTQLYRSNFSATWILQRS